MLLDSQRLRHEVERIHRRYQLEVVEALGLCPWAKDARLAEHVQMYVSFMQEPDIKTAWALIDATMAENSIAVGMLILPALPLDRVPFSHFVSEVRAREKEHSARSAGRIALADFHPNATADERSPERLVPFLRRAPDPMIQIVRQTALDGVRLSEEHGTSFVDASQLNFAALASLASQPAATPPLAERVARNNARTIARLGVPQVEALIDNILADRQTSYAAFGLAAPSWQRSASGSAAGGEKLEKPDS